MSSTAQYANARVAKNSKTLLLWGATQAGKTTLITSALMHQADSLPPLFDRTESRDALVEKGIMQGMHRLLEGRPIASTTSDTIDITLTIDRGASLRLRDIRGGIVVDGTEFKRWAHEVDGILFIVECGGPRHAQQMAAVNSLLSLVSKDQVKIGLAITKCERILCPSDSAWNAEFECWRQPGFQELWRPFESTLKAFGDAVWPVSAFGYDEDRPACVLTEFGRLLPYGVRPKNVCLPLRWFLREFGLSC
ncbi:MAG: hypothetical protein QM775_24450 [Pirellulales bacterium]